MGVGVREWTQTEVPRLYLTSVCAFVPNPHLPFLDCYRVTPSSPFYSTVAVVLYFSSSSLFSFSAACFRPWCLFVVLYFLQWHWQLFSDSVNYLFILDFSKAWRRKCNTSVPHSLYLCCRPRLYMQAADWLNLSHVKQCNQTKTHKARKKHIFRYSSGSLNSWNLSRNSEITWRQGWRCG